MYTFKMVKAENGDKKHSVKFTPASDADAKQCTALYLMRPNANELSQIEVTINDRLENI